MKKFSGLCIGGPWHGERRVANHYILRALVHQSGDRAAPVYTDGKDAPPTYAQIEYRHHVVSDGLRQPVAVWLASGVLVGRDPMDADALVELLCDHIKPLR